MSAHDIEPTILRVTGNTHPLDVTFINEEDLATPWKPEKPSDTRLNIPLPDSLKVTLAALSKIFHKIEVCLILDAIRLLTNKTVSRLKYLLRFPAVLF